MVARQPVKKPERHRVFQKRKIEQRTQRIELTKIAQQGIEYLIEKLEK
jgi:hypothetical protein